MYAKILVPIDGSETSNVGLEEAIKIAKNRGSRVRLVHIVNELFFDHSYTPRHFSGDLVVALLERGRTILAETESQLRRLGIECESVLLESMGGTAASQILDQAARWPADLIVMGTHGRRGLARVTLGSDAEQVARAATVPVMLVRCAPPGAKESPEEKHAAARAV